jgi:hypothetical protein
MDQERPMATTTAEPPTEFATTVGEPDVCGDARQPAPHRGVATTGPVRWRDVVVGAAFEMEEAAVGVVAGLRRATARSGREVAGLAERGALENARGKRWAMQRVGAAVTAIATSPLVDRVVDAQLERVLRPVVRAVLDDVLLLLEQEPERIQALIRGQRETMVDEVVARIRTGAAAGDTAVDRLATRVFHRSPRPVSEPPPSAEPPGAAGP